MIRVGVLTLTDLENRYLQESGRCWTSFSPQMKQQ